MKRAYISILKALLCFMVVLLVHGGCTSSSGEIQPVQTGQPLSSGSLQPGFQLKLSAALNPEVQKWLWIQSLTSDGGLNFFWVEGDGTNPSFFSNSVEDIRPRGRVSLPNWEQKTQLWLPSFWPAAELFLANSSGLWLSPVQFEQLLEQKSIPWIAPWTQGALPEGSPLQPILNLALQQPLKEPQNENTQTKLPHKLQLIDKSEKYRLKFQGKDTEVEVVLAEDPWARYTILKDPQNPLVLKVEFGPEWSLGKLLFSPLSWLKATLEYEVFELDFPQRS